ncbi:MAG: glycine betaine ABC transporter substrate-binding protein [Roseovarius sp.]|nr:glycine betaine ABC transporter substrate-binding protein [Roseovarius sp.]
MRKLTYALALGALSAPAMAQAECGKVSITEMNWASGQVVTAVANFLMTQGYGCDVSVVQSDTVPAVTSVAENGEPDIVTELWLNSTGDGYNQLKAEGKIVEAGPVLDPGGVEGWWVPTYLAEAHPEVKTIEGILANPELVGARFYNCPQGWGCRVVSDNLIAGARPRGPRASRCSTHGSGRGARVVDGRCRDGGRAVVRLLLGPDRAARQV